MNAAFRSVRHNSYHIVIVAFCFLIVLMGVLCSQYYKALQHTLKIENYQYLQEIARQVGGNASRYIADKNAVLGSIAGVLKNAPVKTYEALQPLIQEQQEYWNFRDVLLINEQGRAFDAFGKTVTLAGDSYLREAVVNRRESVSPSQVINGVECMVFVIPVDGLTITGNRIYAIAATYALETFDDILSLKAFSGHAYAYIIQKNGAIVVRSSAKQADHVGYNLLNSLSSVKLEDGSLAQIRDNIADGKEGTVTFYHGDSRFYMVYSPLASGERYLVGFVPVDVVSSKSAMFMNLTLLLCGAITLAFSALVAYQMFTDSRHKQRLEQIAFVDPVTGGNTIEYFYEIAGTLRLHNSKSKYALVYVNVEKFKLLNEEYGRAACDNLLCSLYDSIAENLSPQECMGRQFADNFCVLVTLESMEKLVGRFNWWYDETMHRQQAQGHAWMAPVLECGVYVLEDDELPYTHMIDRAKLALKESPSVSLGKLRHAVYDDAIRLQLFREKYLESRMYRALEEGEFRIFLQPKYNVDSETIGGAEALVRWASPDGIIFPDEFIPLFERNGFIVKLDMWVFQQVCQRIRLWQDAGFEPVKVSVNCSRVLLKNPKFLQSFVDICHENGVCPSYLEIELTETLVFENVHQLSKIIDDIHAAGFGCSMDDFGSGYSSLNLIRNIPVDTIKLDRVFFRDGSGDMARTRSVVGSILSMSRALGMTTVAEGVEEREQVDMLKSLQCDYIQGYFFARPMPVDEFEKMAFGKAKSSQERQAP